jgi:hypothetical protein
MIFKLGVHGRPPCSADFFPDQGVTVTTDLPAAVAVITAMAGVLTEAHTADQWGATIAPVIAEQWSDPIECIPALAAVAVRLAHLLAETTGRDLFDVLAALGAEAAGPPPAGL